MEKLKELLAKLKDFILLNKGYLFSIFCALVLLVIMVVAASKVEVSQPFVPTTLTSSDSSTDASLEQ